MYHCYLVLTFCTFQTPHSPRITCHRRKFSDCDPLSIACWSNKWIESEITALNSPGAQRLCIGQIYANIIKRNHTPLSSPVTVAMVAFMSIVGRFRRAGCSGHSGRYCRGMIVMVRMVCAIVVIIVNYAMTVAMIIVFITLANTSSCCSFVLFTASLEYNRKHSGHQDWQQLPCLHGLSALVHSNWYHQPWWNKTLENCCNIMIWDYMHRSGMV